MKMKTWPLLSVVGEKGFTVDMRENLARDICKGPD